MKDSNWDLDLRAGLSGESRVADLLSLDTVEVKTDRRWHETGNVYIETECWYVGTQSWEPSGIRVSKATHWAFVLEDSVLIVPLHRLKEAVHDSGTVIICNIPPNPSRGFLIRPTTLLEHIRTARATEIAEHAEHEEREKYG
jgi:hypothetical protein